MDRHKIKERKKIRKKYRQTDRQTEERLCNDTYCVLLW